MLLTLPIGIQTFAHIRKDNMLYVDKSGRLLELIENGRRYFLSRPRRFGKSLTLSTLEAMFCGRCDLFSGLAAEQWVLKQADHPAPVPGGAVGDRARASGGVRRARAGL